MIIRNLSNTDPSVRQHKVSKNFTVIQQNKFRDTVPVIGNIKSLNIHSHPTEYCTFCDTLQYVTSSFPPCQA